MKQLIYNDGILVKEPIGITNGSLTLIECTLKHAKKGIIKNH